jgi:hypothetical protein
MNTMTMDSRSVHKVVVAAAIATIFVTATTVFIKHAQDESSAPVAESTAPIVSETAAQAPLTQATDSSMPAAPIPAEPSASSTAPSSPMPASMPVPAATSEQQAKQAPPVIKIAVSAGSANISAKSSALPDRTTRSSNPPVAAPDLPVSVESATSAVTGNADSSVTSSGNAGEAMVLTTDRTTSVPPATSAVTPSPAETDDTITSKVNDQLSSDSVARELHVAVSTTNGVVSLTGTAPNQEAIDRAKELAANVRNVARVDTTGLTVSMN